MAPFFALKYAPPAMAKTTPKQAYPNAAPKDQKYGSIIVVSSVASTYGGCWGPCYTMSSHAALGVVRSGVAVLKGTGVRINCIAAGQIDVGVDLKGVCDLLDYGGKVLMRVVRYAGYDFAVPACKSAIERGMC